MKSEWRAAVRRVMRQAADEEAGADAGRGFNYRWEHVRTVATLADELASLTGADKEIVEAAAWLHDVSKRDGEKHAQTGAQFAATFLPQTDFPEEKIAAVVQAIADHKGLWREEPLTELESMVLWDADKLSKLGLTAIFHFTSMILDSAEPLTMEALIADLRSADWQVRAVDSMHTEPAKRAAATRLAAYEQLLADLEEELEGRDLA